MDEKEYVDILEAENKHFMLLLQSLVKRVNELRDSRNKYWRETLQLKKRVEELER